MKLDQAEFDKFADEYEALIRSSIGASGEGPEYFARYKIEDMARVWNQRPDVRPVRSVLDFGGGIGASLPFISKVFPEASITLVDVSERSLQIAEKRNVSRVTCLHFDGRDLPIEDSQFDLVIASCVFHHIPAEEHVHLIAEIRRVLQNDGLFFLFEHNPWNPLTVQAVNTCPFDENAVLITGPEMRRRMQAAGFSKVEIGWRIFFPGALRVLQPAEKWMEWLPLGAQYRAVGSA